VILQVPLEQLAEQLSLAEAVTDALLRYEGPYGPILEFVELTERLDEPGSAARAAELAMSLSLPHNTLNRAQVEALVWAEGLGR
jgi:EAL and modified HD-GYP domain-containing signal transduction protein